MDVIMHTQVYNGEKTLRRAIESVLRQTYPDFLYYISDNSSTDATAAIIAEYASRDKRIIAIYNKSNEFYAYHNVVRNCCRMYPDGYWAMLDDDDEYAPEFLEKMLAYIQKNDLNVAACGFTEFSEKTGSIVEYRQVSEDMIITGTGFCEHFHEYHVFMRNVCSKLFSLQLLSKCTFETVKNMPSYGGDTIFSIEAFGVAERVGIISGSLHNVFYRQASISRKWEHNRADSNYICDDFRRAFLMNKCGQISRENEEYLQGVYAGSLVEVLLILLNPTLEMEFADKVQNLKSIMEHEKTRKLFREYSYDKGIIEKLRTPVTGWLLTQNECRNADVVGEALDIFSVMYPQLDIITDKNTLAQLITGMPEMAMQILGEYNKLGL